MIPLYARNTEVPVDRSITHIKRELLRYGADAFTFGEEARRAMVQFRYKGRTVRFTIDFPEEAEFRQSERGRPRNEALSLRLWEQACRAKWRALYLFVKAALEAAHGGIVSFDDVFLPFLLLPNDRTVGETMRAGIEAAVSRGQMPRLTLGAPEDTA